MEVTVYVRLLREGVNVWRPVPAMQLQHGMVTLKKTDDYDPEDEVWEFIPGLTVFVEEMTLEGNSVLVVTSAITGATPLDSH